MRFTEAEQRWLAARIGVSGAELANVLKNQQRADEVMREMGLSPDDLRAARRRRQTEHRR